MYSYDNKKGKLMDSYDMWRTTSFLDTDLAIRASFIAAGVILIVIGINFSNNGDKTEINHLKEQSRLQMEALNDVKDDTTSIKEALGRLESKLETP